LLLKSLKSAAERLVPPAVFLLLAMPLCAQTQRPIELVIAIDLTKSVAARTPEGRTSFQKSVEGVGHALGQIATGTHVTIIAITDNSFTQPYGLLSASVASDEGYFGEKLSTARRQLVAAWKKKSQSLSPTFPKTDLIGAFLLAADIFERVGA